MKAVLREITNIPEIRDRSVVRSSVIPSAKYRCSGSLLRLTNGNTTIERRGATKGWAMEVVAAAANSAGGVEEDLIAGRPHQATTAITSAAAVAITIATAILRRRRCETIGRRAAAGSAAASGRSM